MCIGYGDYVEVFSVELLLLVSSFISFSFSFSSFSPPIRYSLLLSSIIFTLPFVYSSRNCFVVMKI